MDINHMLSEQGIDVEVKGSNNFADMQGSNIVVVVAGSGRKPGMTRMDLLKINANVVKSVVDCVDEFLRRKETSPVLIFFSEPQFHSVNKFRRNQDSC